MKGGPYDLLAVGGVGIDTIVRVPALPLPLADSVQVGPIHDYVAHTGNGVAYASLLLGQRTKLIDFIGADRAADLIHARYQDIGSPPARTAARNVRLRGNARPFDAKNCLGANKTPFGRE